MPEQQDMEKMVIVESVDSYDTAAKITRLDGVTQIVLTVDEMMDVMLYCMAKWPGVKMNDKRGWKFPEEV